jgi:hypothetical protein
MDNRERILQAIYEAIDEMNASDPGLGMERSTAAVVVGEASPLDSTSFLSFAISVEQNLERIFEVPVPVIDLIEEIPETGWTVEQMATRIGQEVARGVGA